jgi:steroid delta-isomerase-like uncharacterized protein
MSTDQNVATVRRVFQEALTDGNLDVIDEVYHEEYEFDAPALSASATPTSGREAFKNRVKAFASSFDHVHYDIEECIGEGDIVATRFIFGGFHKAPFAGFDTTNREARISGVHFSRFQDGMIKKTWAGFTNIMEELAPNK